MSVQFDQNDIAEDVSIDLGEMLTASGALDYVNKSIRRINRRLHFTGTTNEVTIDASGIITFPDNAVADIMVLQMECLAVKTQQGEAVSKGIRIKSGSDEVDTTAGFGGYQNAVKNVCGELQQAIKDYLKEAEKDERSDTLSEYGTLMWYGEQRKYEDVDHDGQYAEPNKHPFDSAFDDDQANNL